ncbi:tetratricopeptide repeat protein [Mesoflavibacter profundi]|uniref:Tetratricopeptide repeat protein n=1 Tax=Mesoflavibacter profundi TaxID=2708110 RepID=A0ABT4RZ42_9FLAO|nr:tetratricopeptide repeat protein [Mesoflavibacter profundi]MDA0177035.1 tetratricopeptide repeat protein [Mesoflavibacter profundi]
MKTNIILLLLTVLLTSSCKDTQNKITQTSDYDIYLSNPENTSLKKIEADYNFWKTKLKNTPNQYPYLAKIASAESKLFAATGNIDYLKKAEENLVKLNIITNYNNAGYLRSLARNYISQHKFKEALDVLEKAKTNGENLKGTQKMLFDVHLELGNYTEAKDYLTKVKDLSDFGYLIRLSKWSDHKGDLASAIKYLERAQTIAESSQLAEIKQWTYTNLADFYGHDGQIEKSYNNYLKALQLNPDDAYAKKGIAWIVYAHEKNPKEAKRILDRIEAHHQSPDYHLFKAELAEFEGLDEQKNMHLKTYLDEVNNPNYGDMYNVYTSKLLADSNNEKAVQLAKIEVQNRPTPMSYDLLAWSYFNTGKKEKALEIIDTFVANKTFEPEALFHMAKIYKANGQQQKVANLKNELLESSYELGPVTTKQVSLL